MGKTSVIIFLLFLIGIIVFGFFNPEFVTIKIPGGEKYEVSKFILVLFSIFIGVFITFIFFAIRDTKKFIDNWQNQKRQKQVIKVQELYSKALNAILARNDDTAREALDGILAEEPDHLDALLRLGDLYVLQEDFQKAMTYYQKARTAAPQDLQTLFSIEGVMEKTGRWSESLKYIDDILDIDEDNLAALFRKRVILEKQGRWDDIVSLQQTIIKHTHTEKEKQEEQDRLLGYKYEYGRDSLETNQLEKAKKAFKTVLRLNKDFIPAILGLAEVMLRENESEEAVNLLEKAYDSTYSKIILARLEDLLISLGEPGRLISIYKGSISRRPNDPGTKFFLGKLFYRLEMIDDAFESLAGMEGLGITYPELHHLLGNMYMRRNQPEKAAREYIKMIDIKKSLRLPYCCTRCGFSSEDWSGRCPDCRSWGSYELNLDGTCSVMSSAARS
ncbi:MAG: tetratricopeptide repeat protein [Nitrospirae bacterium]|nr:MAG: tetratricopeptide repeat protein [Nitrospirota bacterium]